MPCYPCTHCNKCGIYSIRLELACATCGADVVTGASSCPECGSPYRNNTVRGRMGKLEGASDYYTEIDRSMGIDAYRTTDMSNASSIQTPKSST